MENLKLEVATKQSVSVLQERVVKLEAIADGSLASAQISILQEQVNRLDPANKSL